MKRQHALHGLKVNGRSVKMDSSITCGRSMQTTRVGFPTTWSREKLPKLMFVKAKPTLQHRFYTVTQVARLVNRTRQQILRDMKAELLSGTKGEIVRNGHRSIGWIFHKSEVQRYIDYRWVALGRESPEWKRDYTPAARELLAKGLDPVTVARELGIKYDSVLAAKRRMK